MPNYPQTQESEIYGPYSSQNLSLVYSLIIFEPTKIDGLGDRNKFIFQNPKLTDQAIDSIHDIDIGTAFLNLVNGYFLSWDVSIF